MGIKKQKKFRLFDVVLASVCIILTVESAAPAASVGNAQYFWWALMLLAFFLPYGLISAELGTTYAGEGGIYDWVRRAFGNKWGSRVAWNYWVNFSLWIASLAVLFTDMLGSLLQLELPPAAVVGIQLGFIWLSVIMSEFRISESKGIINTAAIFKVVIMLGLGAMGIYVAVTRGMATEFTPQSLLPSIDLSGMSFVAIILYNFVGFEIVTTLSSDMENPKKQIPKALFLGGLIIAFFYVFAAFGIGVAIPANELSVSSGLLDSLALLSGNYWIVLIFGLMAIFTLFANLISWSYGTNYVAKYAAENNDMPRLFSKVNKYGMPKLSPILNGVIASTLCILAPIIPSQDLFWSFFSVGVVALLISYLPMFPAFLKLRIIDADIPRPFKISGGPVKLKFMTILPFILLLMALFFTLVPLNDSPEELGTKLPMIGGVVILLICQEIVVHMGEKKRNNTMGGTLTK